MCYSTAGTLQVGSFLHARLRTTWIRPIPQMAKLQKRVLGCVDVRGSDTVALTAITVVAVTAVIASSSVTTTTVTKSTIFS